MYKNSNSYISRALVLKSRLFAVIKNLKCSYSLSCAPYLNGLLAWACLSLRWPLQSASNFLGWADTLQQLRWRHTFLFVFSHCPVSSWNNFASSLVLKRKFLAYNSKLKHRFPRFLSPLSLDIQAQTKLVGFSCLVRADLTARYDLHGL